MTDEKQTDRGSAVSAKAGEKAERGVAHAHKAAEDLGSAARAIVGGYRDKAEQTWDDAKDRVQTFRKDADRYVRKNPAKAVFTALGIGFVLGLMFRR